MRKLNVAKIGVLLLCILLALPMLTGCANELREQKDEEENKQEQLEQIKRKWNEVIHNETNDVKKSRFLYMKRSLITAAKYKQLPLWK